MLRSPEQLACLGLCLILATCQPSAPILKPPLAKPWRSSAPDDAPPPVGSAVVLEPLEVPAPAPCLPPLAPLAIEEFGPKGVVDLGAEPRLRFNQQVVAVGDEMIEDVGLKIELTPKVAGRTRFRTPELLVFEPDGLKRATRYQARVVVLPTANARLRELFQNQPLRWSFETPGPSVADSYPKPDAQLERWSKRHPVLIKLTQPVTVNALSKSLSARSLGADAGTIAIRVEPIAAAVVRRWDWASDLAEDDEPLRNRLFQVRPLEGWPVDRQIQIDLAPDLVGNLGSVPSTTPWRLTWKTPGPLRIDSVTTDEVFCEKPSILVHLSRQISSSQLAYFTVTPRPNDTKIDFSDAYDEPGESGPKMGSVVRLRGSFLPVKTYTLKADPALRDIDGFTLGEGNGGMAWSSPTAIAADPMLNLSNGGIFPSVTSPLFGVTTRQVKSLRVRVAVLDLAQSQQILFGDEDLKSAQLFERLRIPASSTRVRDLSLDVAAPSYWSDLALDLRELIGDVRGTMLVEVVPTALVPRPADAPSAQLPDPQRAVFRRTNLGPVAMHSMTQSIIKVAHLSDGGPAAGVNVARVDGNREIQLGRTDERGILTLPWKAGTLPPGDTSLSVSEPSTNDRALLRLRAPREQRRDGKATLLQRDERPLVHFVTDRDAYRPEESIALVGFAMVDTPFTRSNLRLLPEGSPVVVRVTDRESKSIAEQTLGVDSQGKFWARLPIAKAARLGSLTVTAETQGTEVEERVKLEDFRVPEFSVMAQITNEPLLVGERPTVKLRANHFSGVPVDIQTLAYQSSCTPSRHSVPGLETGWVVGTEPHRDRGYGTVSGRRAVEVSGSVGRGLAEFAADLPKSDQTSLKCSVSMEVTDASQQAIGAESTVRIHPASFYLALRPPEDLRAGDSASIAIRGLQIDGQRHAVRNVMLDVKRTWREQIQRAVEGRIQSRWEKRHESAAKCQVDATPDSDAVCQLGKVKSGEYSILARAADGARTAITTSEFWVHERSEEPPPKVVEQRDDEPPNHLTLRVERIGGEAKSDRLYAPNDHLRLNLRSPCENGSGVVLVERAGIRESHAIRLVNHAAHLNFSLDDTWAPEVFLEATTLCQSAPGYPTLEHAQEHIRVSTEHRQLKVALSLPASAAPGQLLPVAIEVHDADDKPLRRGHVAVWAVDEAVLSLGDYRVTSPLERFLPQRSSETKITHDYHALLRAYVPTPVDPLLDPDQCGESWGSGGLGLSGIGAGGGGMGEGMTTFGPKPARARFETTPIFIGEQSLDEQGRARIEGRLPDNLTTFRVTALASAPLIGDSATGRFGIGESEIQVTTKFILRPALPRQLRPGDSAEIAAILQNQLSVGGKVTVEAKVEPKISGLAIVGESKKLVTLGATEQLRVPFQILAERPVVSQVELRASFVSEKGEVIADAVRLPLPVAIEPASVERAAFYGTLDSSTPAAVAARFPEAVVPTTGGVSLSLSTTLLGDLEDAFKYLIDYPYGCIEQTSSRVLALVLAREIASRYGLDKNEVERRLAAGLERIASMQTASGGFSYWPGENRVHPYATGFATWVLLQAEQRGISVPKPLLERALDYLGKWLEGAASTGDDDSSPWHSPANRLSERAIAINTLAEAGRPVASNTFDEALSLRKALPSFARTLLLSALARATPNDPRLPTLVDELLSAVNELPATAHVREVNADRLDYLFDSQGRSDAMALRALLALRPNHPSVPKLARGLLDARASGRWRNTQENAYSILSMLEYARRFEAKTPNLSARAWIGNQPFVNAKLTAGTPSRNQWLPMSQIVTLPKPVSLVLQREGEGRLYYRLGTEWQPASSDVPARDQGLPIERSIRLRRGAAEATIPLGAAVVFDIVIRSRTPMSYVVVDVPVPAGLEPVLDNLGQGHAVSRLGGASSADYEERRPDRVLLFFDRLAAGVHQHTVQLRAVTPGQFALPPARAEAMYMPEIYGRTTSSRLMVLAK